MLPVVLRSCEARGRKLGDRSTGRSNGFWMNPAARTQPPWPVRISSPRPSGWSSAPTPCGDAREAASCPGTRRGAPSKTSCARPWSACPWRRIWLPHSTWRWPYHPVYDCLYLALALRETTQVITADTRFAAAARRSPSHGAHVRTLGEWGSSHPGARSASRPRSSHLPRILSTFGRRLPGGRVDSQRAVTP
jgi:hypothetical protein